MAFIVGLKDPNSFLVSLSGALRNYGNRNGIEDAMAICEDKDGIAYKVLEGSESDI